MNQTDNLSEVGRHKFELAGLGLAPFRFVGATDNVITHPDGTQKPGSSCDYCSTGIRLECWVKSADGRRFKVGCDCIRKVGDTGLLKAYKSSPEFRARQRALRRAKALAVATELQAIIDGRKDALASLPHPSGFIDRKTGDALSLLDYAQWMLSHAGAAGQAGLLKFLLRTLPQH